MQKAPSGKGLSPAGRLGENAKSRLRRRAHLTRRHKAGRRAFRDFVSSCEGSTETGPFTARRRAEELRERGGPRDCASRFRRSRGQIATTDGMIPNGAGSAGAHAVVTGMRPPAASPERTRLKAASPPLRLTDYQNANDRPSADARGGLRRSRGPLRAKPRAGGGGRGVSLRAGAGSMLNRPPLAKRCRAKRAEDRRRRAPRMRGGAAPAGPARGARCRCRSCMSCRRRPLRRPPGWR